MNILFIGPYRQSDGWGNAAKEYLRALRLTDHSISARPIYLNSQSEYADTQEFKELEENSPDNYDIIIQNCLPHMFRHYGGVKNIGLAFFESTVDNTPWPNCINLLDEMWVCSKFEQRFILDSVNPIVRCIPIPTDPFKYIKKYDCSLLDKHKHEFKFYFIGELNSRKNIEALITAFHREFLLNEPVRLVLKLNNVGRSKENTLDAAKVKINHIKQRLGLYKNPGDYRPDIIITEYLPEEELYGLHQQCQCFVTASSGEAFCIPAFDAMSFGNNVIVNKVSSMAEYLDPNTDCLVHAIKTPAIAEDRPLDFLYNGRDWWYEVITTDLQRVMRKTYEDKIPVSKPLDYSHHAIARKMMGAL